jgi:hypothetical protein
MFTYVQRTGNLYHNGQLIGQGYSGYPPHKNNPDSEQIHNFGPIPRGLYTIGIPHDSPHVGPYAMSLMPEDGTNTYGRSDFLMHGDSISNPGLASHGCIIQNKGVRHVVGTSNDNQLKVVAEEKDLG